MTITLHKDIIMVYTFK